MRKIIYKLRQQSEETRRHVLNLVTFFLAIILIILWIMSLGSNLSNEDTQTKMKQDLQPFSVLKDNLVD